MAGNQIESLTFKISGLADGTFTVFRVTGEDALSRMFRFEIEMIADDPLIDEASIFGREAQLEMIRFGETAQVNGIVAELRQGDATERGQYVYTALLVPRLHRLSLSRQNQIHGTTDAVTVADVIPAELTGSQLKGPGAAVAGRLSDSDFKMRLIRSYPKRDYIVQYNESDLDFICRLAEAHGIFFFFEHEGGKDIVVFGDNKVSFNPSDQNLKVPYIPGSGMVEGDGNAVHRFARVSRPMPTKVVLRDYNYRLPHISLTAEAAVDAQGHGVVVEYGDHFRTPEEGQALAQIRAEEIKARNRYFTGESDCIKLSAGHLITLTDHFRTDFNTRYVITRIRHQATMALPGISDIVGGDFETAYSNSFDCLPSTMEYRPPRLTPKPVMAGLSNATVDAEGSGTRAEIDDQGRYKIRQAFDLRDESDGRASRYMRKAEPYGGGNHGMHFPLLKNTEVVVACVNGDPDRPIIMGTVPNPRNKSVITNKDQTSNRLRTTSGVTLQIDDGSGTSGSGGSSGAGSDASLAPQRALEGAPPTPDLAPARAESSSSTDESRIFLQVTDGTESTYSDDTYLRLGDSRSSGETDYVSDFTSVADGVLLYTPDNLNSLIKKASYWRVEDEMRVATSSSMNHVSETDMGLAAKAIGITASSSAPSTTTTPGASLSDGVLTITTDSDLNETVGGDLNQTVTGSVNQTVLSDSTTSNGGDDVEVTSGNTVEVFMGNAVGVTLGAAEDFSLSTSFELTIGISIAIELSAKIEVTISAAITYEGAVSILVNDGGKIGVKLGYEAEYNVLGATANEVEAEATTVEASAKTVEAKDSTVTAESKTVEASTSSVTAKAPAIEVTV